MVQEFLESEVTEYLGRKRYERGGERPGYRNGYKSCRLDLSLGNKEGYEAWLEHFRNLTRRELGSPLTVTTDGATGLIKAVEAVWPEADRIAAG